MYFKNLSRDLLKHHPDGGSIEFDEGWKAIRFVAWCIPVDVALTEQFDMGLAMHGLVQTSRLKQFYEEYPGA